MQQLLSFCDYHLRAALAAEAFSATTRIRVGRLRGSIWWSSGDPWQEANDGRLQLQSWGKVYEEFANANIPAGFGRSTRPSQGRLRVIGHCQGTLRVTTGSQCFSRARWNFQGSCPMATLSSHWCLCATKWCFSFIPRDDGRFFSSIFRRPAGRRSAVDSKFF